MRIRQLAGLALACALRAPLVEPIKRKPPHGHVALIISGIIAQPHRQRPPKMAAAVWNSITKHVIEPLEAQGATVVGFVCVGPKDSVDQEALEHLRVASNRSGSGSSTYLHDATDADADWGFDASVKLGTAKSNSLMATTHRTESMVS